jgi:hypothetical protein
MKTSPKKTSLQLLPSGTRKILQAALACLLCAVFTACIGATPSPKRTRTATGTETKDISFIHPGQTTRAEVKEKLKLIDTGYEGEHFFLGRWSSSTWGGWFVLAGYYNGVAGGGRVWKSGNLLVQFDAAGLVTSSTPFEDAKAVPLLAPVAADTPLQLTPPLELQVKYWKTKAANERFEARIVLSASTFDFEEMGEQKKRHKFAVPAQDLLRVETPITLRIPDPALTAQRLRFSRDLKKLGGSSGKDLNLQLTLPQLVTLMSYASQAGKSSPGATPAADAK